MKVTFFTANGDIVVYPESYSAKADVAMGRVMNHRAEIIYSGTQYPMLFDECEVEFDAGEIIDGVVMSKEVTSEKVKIGCWIECQGPITVWLGEENEEVMGK